MNFTAMGDTVNVAARLEQSAEPGAILVSEAVQQAPPIYLSFALSAAPTKEPHRAGQYLSGPWPAPNLLR